MNKVSWGCIAKTFILAQSMIISAGIIANSVLNIEVSTPSSKQTLQILFMFIL